MDDKKEHLKVVIVGHVDHGKSTIIGRLLADTGSLPEGKLEQVKQQCRENARPFEYAFLLDALENERSQGITIDMARCFFNTEKRNYIIIDAPGHIEFLKNMVTGAARADAALLTIDANEGIQENSKRHGYMLAMLGVEQVSVLVNKFDLVDYDKEVYDNIVEDYTEFLKQIGVKATNFIPVSGRDGDNIASKSDKTSWYKGPIVLDQIDMFDKIDKVSGKPFRMPVQDIYKFTQNEDDRRIVAGTIETGSIKVGDDVIFQPSGKESTVKSIEGFNLPEQQEIFAPYASGVTLNTQIYIKPGELMVKKSEPQPEVGTRFVVNIFWLAKTPMIKGKRYKLKLASARTAVELVDIINVLDASELNSEQNKEQFDRHDVGKCIIETSKPIACDLISEIEGTGRFVIVDNFEIAGGGVIVEKADDDTVSVLQEHVEKREIGWDKGEVSAIDRASRNNHKGKFVIFTGAEGTGVHALAKAAEKMFFKRRLNTYYLGIKSVFEGLDADLSSGVISRDEEIRRLGELSRIMTDAGLLFITAVNEIDDYELQKLKLLNSPNELLVINLGENRFNNFEVDLELPENPNVDEVFPELLSTLNKHNIILEYSI